MTIYWAGGEDTSFQTLTSNTAVSTSAGLYRSGYARESIQVVNGGGNVPPRDYALTPTFGPVSSFWVHAQFSTAGYTTTESNIAGITLYDSSAVARLAVVGTGTSGQIAIVSRNAAGTITTLATSASGVLPSGTSPIPIDFFINYSSSGQATVYINGTNVCDTGPGVNITTDSATALAQIALGTFNTDDRAIYWSEGLVQSGSTLGFALWTLVPAAAGATQSWTPNTVGNIDEATINDANFISTTTANSLTEWTTNTTAPSGTWTVEAVVQETRVEVGATGPQHFEWLLHVSGADYTQGSVAATTGFLNYGVGAGSIWSINPHTSTTWALSDITAGIQIGIESLT